MLCCFVTLVTEMRSRSVARRHQLDPNDQLFSSIMGSFINNLFVLLPLSSHLYCIDLFHDSTPPCDSLQCLTQLSSSVYKALVAADPQAVWVLPGDMFVDQSEFWGDSQVCAVWWWAYV